MERPAVERATQLLLRLRESQAGAADELLQLVYDELKGIAAGTLGLQGDGMLNPTALVHEAYLRLFKGDGIDVRDREHFFALAATAMRHVLIDHERARRTRKRGDGMAPSPLHELVLTSEVKPSLDLLELDEALTRLEAQYPRVARIFELRFFSGLDIAEVADLLGVAASTVEKDWRLGRAFLRRELS